MNGEQLSLLGEAPLRPPVVVAYGMGVDSTAMLVGLHQRGERPDLILFADTGGEKPETYAFLPIVQAWLASVGFPPVVTVRKVVRRFKIAPYATLEENCLVYGMLPSLAYGRKACSQKWKREPQDKFCRSWLPARAAWGQGLRVEKLIGYDAGPKDSKRAWKLTNDRWYAYRYPLREWGWDREACQRQIAAAGLPVPPKSACFFCPAMPPVELGELCREHPDLARRIAVLELNAAPQLLAVEGLWRKASKKRPGSMVQFLAEHHPDVLFAGVPSASEGPARPAGRAA
jgi:hypothetical protein